jgi:hypothetical protein
MSFDLQPDSEVVGAWFTAYEDRDWMCMVWRDSPIVGWTIRWRTRYYDPDEPDPWAGVDRRSWETYQTPVDTPRDGIRDSLRRMQRGMLKEWPQRATVVDEVLSPDGSVVGFFRELSGRPWAHPKSDAELGTWQEDYLAGRLPAQARKRAREARRRRGRRRE